MDWTAWRDLLPSTGYIFLVVLLLWIMLGGIIYYAFVAGATSMKEDVKYRVVEHDPPIKTR